MRFGIRTARGCSVGSDVDPKSSVYRARHGDLALALRRLNGRHRPEHNIPVAIGQSCERCSLSQGVLILIRRTIVTGDRRSA